MASIDIDTLLDTITRFYLKSRDFNGIPTTLLAKDLNVSIVELLEPLSALIQKGLVSIIYGDIHPNPHIKALQDEPADRQIEKLSTSKINGACVYPLPTQLEKIVDPNDYEGKPYVLSLALGAPQLEFRSFDLSVLEYYRNDPRYSYTNDDIRGSISVHDAYFESENMPERDQVVLQSFGFSYDSELNRAVAVFLRYLADLSPQHQQIWKAKELSGDYLLHPDYYRTSIIGDWGEKLSIFAAFLEELKIINQMSDAMGRPPLFRQDFTKDDAPREFSFIVRPTLKALNDFIHLLDKMMSDNINLDFFRHEVPYEREQTRKDGKVVISTKGTITILDDWLRSHFRTNDWEPINQTITTFKEIRTKRQKPAHGLNDDSFDQKYFHEQRQLIIRAYEAIRTLRLLFWNHPSCKKVAINSLLWDGKIWTY